MLEIIYETNPTKNGEIDILLLNRENAVRALVCRERILICAETNDGVCINF